MNCQIDGSIVTREDWAGTQWNIDLQDASYVKTGTLIIIDADLKVSYEQGGRTIGGDIQATVASNGLLWFDFVTAFEGMSAPGDVVPAGTTMTIVLSMIVFTDSDGQPDRHVVALTLAGDPQDAGVMGAEEGGTGGDLETGAS